MARGVHMRIFIWVRDRWNSSMYNSTTIIYIYYRYSVSNVVGDLLFHCPRVWDDNMQHIPLCAKVSVRTAHTSRHLCRIWLFLRKWVRERDRQTDRERGRERERVQHRHWYIRSCCLRRLRRWSTVKEKRNTAAAAAQILFVILLCFYPHAFTRDFNVDGREQAEQYNSATTTTLTSNVAYRRWLLSMPKTGQGNNNNNQGNGKWMLTTNERRTKRHLPLATKKNNVVTVNTFVFCRMELRIIMRWELLCVCLGMRAPAFFPNHEKFEYKKCSSGGIYVVAAHSHITYDGFIL